MESMKFTATLKSFFDRDSIMTPAKKAEKKFLGRMGAYCRSIARNSIKRGGPGEVSLPGDPPLSHEGSLGKNKKGKSLSYKDFIFFSYDAARHAVFIGPVLLNGRAGKQVCETLEYGGAEMIWVTVRGQLVQVAAYFQPRPHMRPALAATIASPKFEAALTDCVINEAGTSARMR